MGLSFTSCNKKDNPTVVGPNTYTATINAASEKPTSTTSTAIGAFVGTLDETTRTLSYTVTYSGLTPVAGHLHRVTMANGTGPVVFGFPNLTSPIIGTAVFRNQVSMDSLKNGFYYANLHTATYPGGEIRGDIKK